MLFHAFHNTRDRPIRVGAWHAFRTALPGPLDRVEKRSAILKTVDSTFL